MAVREWLEDRLRGLLGKPIHHGHAHGEWPWFAAGHVSEAEVAEFSAALAAFEKEEA